MRRAVCRINFLISMQLRDEFSRQSLFSIMIFMQVRLKHFVPSLFVVFACSICRRFYIENWNFYTDVTRTLDTTDYCDGIQIRSSHPWLCQVGKPNVCIFIVFQRRTSDDAIFFFFLSCDVYFNWLRSKPFVKNKIQQLSMFQT